MEFVVDCETGLSSTFNVQRSDGSFRSLYSPTTEFEEHMELLTGNRSARLASYLGKVVSSLQSIFIAVLPLFCNRAACRLRESLIVFVIARSAHHISIMLRAGYFWN
jgi:hypothetical protein